MSSMSKFEASMTDEEQARGAALARWAGKTKTKREELSAALWELAVEANAAGQLDRERVLTQAAAALRAPEVWPLVEPAGARACKCGLPTDEWGIHQQPCLDAAPSARSRSTNGGDR